MSHIITKVMQLVACVNLGKTDPDWTNPRTKTAERERPAVSKPFNGQVSDQIPRIH